MTQIKLSSLFGCFMALALLVTTPALAQSKNQRIADLRAAEAARHYTIFEKSQYVDKVESGLTVKYNTRFKVAQMQVTYLNSEMTVCGVGYPMNDPNSKMQLFILTTGKKGKVVIDATPKDYAAVCYDPDLTVPFR